MRKLVFMKVAVVSKKRYNIPMSTFARISIILLVLAGIYFFTKDDTRIAETPQNTNSELNDTTPAQDIIDDEPPTPSAEGDASVIVNEDQGEIQGSTLSKNVTLPKESATWTVSYSSNGFFPSTLTIKKGDSVRFVNNSDDEVSIKSEPNPEYPNMATFESTAAYGSDGIFSYTFKDTGEWRYKNINNQSLAGTIVVK